jgi:hypothetical protein
MICMFPVFITAQTTSLKFSVAQLQQDYEIFVRALKEAHPGLYRYTTKESFDSIFTATSKKIDHEMTEEEFYTLLMPVIAGIKCGHTKWHRSNRPDDRYPFHTDSLFPLKLYFNNDKAYLLYSYNVDTTLKPSTEIISINEKPVASIIDELRKYITIDGNAESGLYEELNHSFNGYYATFIETTPVYNLTCISGNDSLNVSLPAVDLATIQKRESADKPAHKLPLRLSYLSPNIALLTIENFYVDKKEQKYYPFIDSVFNDLKKKHIDNLVIDVRNNEGGEENQGGYLYSYLTDTDFRYYNKITMTQKEKFSFREYAWLPKLFGLMHLFMKEKNGEVYFTKQKYLHMQPPQKNAYTGDVYVLINGMSFSTTTELASMLHNNKKAIFIGQETGGAYYGNNSGVFAIVTLPNTHLTAGIPLMAYYSNVSGYPYKDRGILPDHAVNISVYDILQKKDAVMEYTLQLIRSNNNKATVTSHYQW